MVREHYYASYLCVWKELQWGKDLQIILTEVLQPDEHKLVYHLTEICSFLHTLS